MRIPRFYCPINLQIQTTINMPDAVFRHAIQVLRLKQGENLILFNGEGGEYLTEVTSVQRRSAQVSILTHHEIARESPCELTLALALIKPDKMDFALQKAVELGVHHIQPLITQRSTIKLNKDKFDKKRHHWEGVIISACEQSGRCELPSLSAPISLPHYLQQHPEHTHLTFAPGDYPRLNAIAPTLPKALSVLIGPEGGFTDEEITLCQQANAHIITLGPRILRAETAALSTLTLLQHYLGDI